MEIQLVIHMVMYTWLHLNVSHLFFGTQKFIEYSIFTTFPRPAPHNSWGVHSRCVCCNFHFSSDFICKSIYFLYICDCMFKSVKRSLSSLKCTAVLAEQVTSRRHRCCYSCAISVVPVWTSLWTEMLRKRNQTWIYETEGPSTQTCKSFLNEDQDPQT